MRCFLLLRLTLFAQRSLARRLACTAAAPQALDFVTGGFRESVRNLQRHRRAHSHSHCMRRMLHAASVDSVDRREALSDRSCELLRTLVADYCVFGVLHGMAVQLYSCTSSYRLRSCMMTGPPACSGRLQHQRLRRGCVFCSCSTRPNIPPSVHDTSRPMWRGRQTADGPDCLRGNGARQWTVG